MNTLDFKRKEESIYTKNFLKCMKIMKKERKKDWFGLV